ncbi:sialidase family protein [Jiangella sp. DSM 45060]|uniref:sialidase family protein n=1 Tax=Jiangella sp. DSM 45060 TaxID=1798224 RepID=UPI00087DE932|nr:sialidase family protein [Jiangella sp. DSM 45060]SDT33029.1 sialidase-1 [Jiangella sp. DSM 45060]
MTIHRSIRYGAVLVAAMVSATLALAPVQNAPAAADAASTVDPFQDRTTVLFSTPHVPSGCHRIPAIVRAVDGSLLAFAERRMHTCADKSHIRTVVRRLPPGATEWLPEQTVVSGEADDPEAPATRGNPGPVVYRRLPGAPATDAPDGRIVLLGTHNPVNPETPGSNHRTAPRTPYVVHSDDNGVTWSAPRALPELDDPAWGHYATGPVHAIQLTRGEHAGRIVAGANYDPGDGFGAMLVYSDDGGVTWHKGAQARYATGEGLIPQEISLVELANGDVFAWTRQNWGGGTPEEEADPYVRPHRAVAISKDGGQTYASGFTLQPGFEAPPIQSSALRVRATDEGDGYNQIISMAPSVNVEPRIRPTIRSSFDEGLTWQSVDTPLESTDEGVQVYGTNDRAVSVEECACWGGYSDMVELPGGGLGLLYERGTTDYRSEIAFVRLTAQDLNTPATTTDARGRSALVFDGVTTTQGRYGQGFAFDGDRGRVQLPFRTTPVLGAGDFTVSTWVRYDDASRDQALFWAYGMDGAPQVWLRAEPGQDRIRGMVTTAGGSASVASDGAYADGAWHHVALRREGDTVSLHVDGVEVASASGAAGAVSGDDPTPIYLGQRLDGANRLDGALDEFRVYDRALTAAELIRLRTRNANGIPGLTAHLPMNAVIPPGA